MVITGVINKMFKKLISKIRKGNKDKKTKTIPFGKHDEGKLSKELREFFKIQRINIDEVWKASSNNHGDASKSLEKTLEEIMTQKRDKELEPISFTLGVIFCASRTNYLESKKGKKAITKETVSYIR